MMTQELQSLKAQGVTDEQIAQEIRRLGLNESDGSDWFADTRDYGSDYAA